MRFGLWLLWSRRCALSPHQPCLSRTARRLIPLLSLTQVLAWVLSKFQVPSFKFQVPLGRLTVSRCHVPYQVPRLCYFQSFIISSVIPVSDLPCSITNIRNLLDSSFLCQQIPQIAAIFGGATEVREVEIYQILRMTSLTDLFPYTFFGFIIPIFRTFCESLRK